MSFLRRNKDKDESSGLHAAPPTIDPNTGLPPPYEPPDLQAEKKKDAPKGNIFQRLRQYIVDSYNGLYKIVLEPSMPTKQSVLLIVLGVIIGLIFAYAIQPVEFTGASPRRMNEDAIEQWVRMVAVGYEENIAYDGPTALAVLNQLPNPKQVVANLSSSAELPPWEQDAVTNLQNIDGYNEITGTPAPQDPGLIGSALPIIVLILAILIITPILVVVWRLLIYPNIVAGIIEAIKVARNPEYRAAKEKSRKDLETLKDQKRLKEEMAKNVVADVEYGVPVMQNISIYAKGRNYDDSFAIELGEDQGNQFLGECGATIATKVGDEVQSVEFWAFDMATQDNLTKMFVAPGSVNDPAVQAKLSPRVDNPQTDIAAAQPGVTHTLESSALRVQAEVVSITYNDAAGTPNSGIEAMQIKVSAWHKQGAPAGAPAMPAPQALPDYSNIEFDPPPPMPSGGLKPLAPPPAGGRSLDDYDDIEFDPPPPMPSGGLKPLAPPPMQPPPGGNLNPLSPPPMQMPPPPRWDDDDDDDESLDDPFGGTGDFTPLS